MTVTALGHTSTSTKPYKIYAVQAIKPHPNLKGASLVIKKNGKTVSIRTEDILEVIGR